MASCRDSICGLEFVPLSSIPKVLTHSFGHGVMNQTSLPSQGPNDHEWPVQPRYFLTASVGVAQFEGGRGAPMLSKVRSSHFLDPGVAQNTVIRPAILAVDSQHVIIVENSLAHNERDVQASPRSASGSRGLCICISDIRELSFSPEYQVPVSAFCAPAERAQYAETARVWSGMHKHTTASLEGAAVAPHSELLVTVTSVVLRVTPGGDRGNEAPYDVVIDVAGPIAHPAPSPEDTISGASSDAVLSNEPDYAEGELMAATRSPQRRPSKLSIMVPRTLQKMCGPAWLGTSNISAISDSEFCARPFRCSVVLNALTRTLLVLSRVHSRIGQTVAGSSKLTSFHSAHQPGVATGDPYLQGASMARGRHLSGGVTFKDDFTALRVSVMSLSKRPSGQESGTSRGHDPTGAVKTVVGNGDMQFLCERFMRRFLPREFKEVRLSSNSCMTHIQQQIESSNRLDKAASLASVSPDGSRWQVIAVVASVFAELANDMTDMYEEQNSKAVHHVRRLCKKWSEMLARMEYSCRGWQGIATADSRGNEQSATLQSKLLAASTALESALDKLKNERQEAQREIAEAHQAAESVRLRNKERESREAEVMREFLSQMRVVDAERLLIKGSIAQLREELGYVVQDGAKATGVLPRAVKGPSSGPALASPSVVPSARQTKRGTTGSVSPSVAPPRPSMPLKGNSHAGTEDSRRQTSWPLTSPSTAPESLAVVHDSKRKRLQEDIERLEKMATEYSEALTAIEKKQEAVAAILSELSGKEENEDLTRSAERSLRHLTSEKERLEQEVLDAMEALRKIKHVCRTTSATQCGGILAARNRLSGEVDELLLSCGRERAKQDILRSHIALIEPQRNVLLRQLSLFKAEKAVVKDLAREAAIAGSINSTLGLVLSEAEAAASRRARELEESGRMLRSQLRCNTVASPSTQVEP